MKKFLLAILFLASAALCLADPTQPAYEKFPSAIGVFAVTAINDGGLQYQHWYGRTGYQVMGGILYNDSTSYTGRTMDDWIAGEFLSRVYGDRFADWLSGQLYVWGMLGYHGYISQTVDYAVAGTPLPATPSTVTVSPYVNAGLGGVGFGIEIILFDHFSVPVEFGYAGEYPFNYAKPQVNFSASGGFRYRF
jgi:hypothetical protein